MCVSESLLAFPLVCALQVQLGIIFLSPPLVRLVKRYVLSYPPVWDLYVEHLFGLSGDAAFVGAWLTKHPSFLLNMVPIAACTFCGSERDEFHLKKDDGNEQWFRVRPTLLLRRRRWKNVPLLPERAECEVSILLLKSTIFTTLYKDKCDKYSVRLTVVTWTVITVDCRLVEMCPRYKCALRAAVWRLMADRRHTASACCTCCCFEVHLTLAMCFSLHVLCL